MHCTKCGVILNPGPDTKFCVYCGEGIVRANQEYQGDSLSLQTGRPQKVRIAMILLYIFLGVRFVGNIIYPIQFEGLPFEGLPSGITSFLVLVGFGFHWWFIYMIWKGRNWARIVYFVLFLISCLVLLPQIPTLFIDPIFGLFTIVGEVALVIAFVLLFQKQSSNWFNRFLQPQQKKRSTPTLDTLNCRGCGEELKAGADFCTQCGAKVSTIATVPEQLTYCNQCGAILQEDKTNQSSMLVLGCLGVCVAILGIILCATVILFIIGFPMAILGGLLAGYGFTLLVKNSAKKKFICPKCHISFPRSDAN